MQRFISLLWGNDICIPALKEKKYAGLMDQGKVNQYSIRLQDSLLGVVYLVENVSQYLGETRMESQKQLVATRAFSIFCDIHFSEHDMCEVAVHCQEFRSWCIHHSFRQERFVGWDLATKYQRESTEAFLLLLHKLSYSLCRVRPERRSPTKSR